MWSASDPASSVARIKGNPGHWGGVMILKCLRNDGEKAKKLLVQLPGAVDHSPHQLWLCKAADGVKVDSQQHARANLIFCPKIGRASGSAAAVGLLRLLSRVLKFGRNRDRALLLRPQ